MTKILGNRSVIGEFQPYRFLDGDRVPDGPAIAGYFPRVVSDNLFFRTQQARGQRRVVGAGRKGAFVSNLFSGLAECAYCGARMHFINKGRGPKGATYLVCDSARRGLGCEHLSWRYDDFEASFLAFVQEVDLEPIARSDEDAQSRVVLEKAIEALQGRKGELERRRQRTYDLLDDDAVALDFLREKLRECEQELDTVETDLRDKQLELT